MNIIKRELRANLKSLIIWSLSMVFLVYVGMVKYSAFSQAGQSINTLFEQMPPALLKIFSMEGLDLTKISAFYALFYLYFNLLGGIHASMLGATIISKEERDKTADFLFVKPIQRKKIITGKVIAAVINVLILNAVTCISSIVFIDMYNTGESITSEVFRLIIALLFIQIVFLSIGLAISAIVKSTKKATGLVTFVLLTMFMLSVGIDLNEDLKALVFLTPFKYFATKDVMYNANYSVSSLLLVVIITCVGLWITYQVYPKKDLHV